MCPQSLIGHATAPHLLLVVNPLKKLFHSKLLIRRRAHDIRLLEVSLARRCWHLPPRLHACARCRGINMEIKFRVQGENNNNNNNKSNPAL